MIEDDLAHGIGFQSAAMFMATNAISCRKIHCHILVLHFERREKTDRSFQVDQWWRLIDSWYTCLEGTQQQYPTLENCYLLAGSCPLSGLPAP